MNKGRPLCYFNMHDWYHGTFQTGKKSEFTGDHVGVNGRVCLDCDKKQQKVGTKYITVEEWEDAINV